MVVVVADVVVCVVVVTVESVLVVDVAVVVVIVVVVAVAVVVVVVVLVAVMVVDVAVSDVVVAVEVELVVVLHGPHRVQESISDVVPHDPPFAMVHSEQISGLSATHVKAASLANTLQNHSVSDPTASATIGVVEVALNDERTTNIPPFSEHTTR
jgi:hypothetical protein